MATVYVADSSALIDLNILYPQSVFHNVWSNLETLIQANRLISPNEVFKEIEKKDDELFSWCKNNRRMFVPNNAEHLKYVSEIMASYPELVPNDALNPVADPFVIAVGIVLKDQSLDSSVPIVVAHESRRSTVKIPAICTHYQIGNMRLLEMFSAEGWNF